MLESQSDGIGHHPKQDYVCGGANLRPICRCQVFGEIRAIRPGSAYAKTADENGVYCKLSKLGLPKTLT
jgi:hypothetical protein